MRNVKVTESDVCKKFMETILWSLLDSRTHVLTHDELCRKSQDIVQPKDSARYLKTICHLCAVSECPNLASMIVNQKHKLPGHWYYDLYEALNPGTLYHRVELFQNEVAKVMAYKGWAQIAKRYFLDEELVLQLSLRDLVL